jgi:hypothetical protein
MTRRLTSHRLERGPGPRAVRDRSATPAGSCRG